MNCKHDIAELCLMCDTTCTRIHGYFVATLTLVWKKCEEALPTSSFISIIIVVPYSEGPGTVNLTSAGDLG